jgi:CxxC motif-containing protein (DUF1111 family)
MRPRRLVFGISLLTVMTFAATQTPQAQLSPFRASDPGVRGDPPGAGEAIAGLTEAELKFFRAGLEEFEEVEGVEDGLGPGFNFASCAGCHAQPATGGTAPPVNPQFSVPTLFPNNTVPPFITENGPVREARFKYRPDGSRDGGVHNLFVIGGCGAQEDFEKQIARDNVIFRIPTALFGAGLIEQIPDQAILDNLAARSLVKRRLGISGRPNRSGNDGTITRFGWKAQTKSLLLFAGEAYNVEMGITSELFQSERGAPCRGANVGDPNTGTPTGGGSEEVQSSAEDEVPISAIEQFAFFMRFLAPATPSPDTPGGAHSIARGRQLFAQVGCALCHTPTLRTGNATVVALRNQEVNLFSDLALHQMGPGLADDIIQGGADPAEFRTAPLWGLGQRIFFLHDGRTTDLLEAIRAHRSAGNWRFGPSEANAVIDQFNALPATYKQDLLNFLRSL